jgi:hypothetical protein
MFTDFQLDEAGAAGNGGRQLAQRVVAQLQQPEARQGAYLMGQAAQLRGAAGGGGGRRGGS